MRLQLSDHYADREREAVERRPPGGGRVGDAAQLVAIARRRVQVETERVLQELAVERDAGAAVKADYRRARLELSRRRPTGPRRGRRGGRPT